MNSKAKIYLGLPASPSVTYDKYMYLQPDEAGQILQHFQCKYPELFGGVMVYEATASEANAVHGTPYADAVKGYLKDSSCATKPSNTSIRSAPTFPVSSVASMTNPSSAIVSTQSLGSQPTRHLVEQLCPHQGICQRQPSIRRLPLSVLWPPRPVFRQ